MKHYIYILLFGGILLLNSCGGNRQAEGSREQPEETSLIEVTREQFRSMKMEMSPLREKEFDSVIKASGRITVPPKSRAKVTPYIGGYVKSVSLLAGDKVVKGQPLLTLESPEYIDMQRDYLEIAGQMEYFKSEYERQKMLFNEKISSQKKYLEAESEYKKAKAEYESLRRKLDMLNINPSQVEKGEFVHVITVYAPISGDIAVINASMGMAVSPLDVIMEIIDVNTIHLELAVFEKDVFSLNKGQKVNFTIPQVNTEAFEAEVSVIGTSVLGNERVVNVYASLDEATKRKLLYGMFVEAQLITTSRNALSVPFDAIVTEESNSFLLVLDAEDEERYVFRKTLIKTGERSDDFMEVFPDDNINTDANVLIKGVYDIM